jgi:hypothetical protein
MVARMLMALASRVSASVIETGPPGGPRLHQVDPGRRGKESAAPEPHGPAARSGHELRPVPSLLPGRAAVRRPRAPGQADGALLASVSRRGRRGRQPVIGTVVGIGEGTGAGGVGVGPGLVGLGLGVGFVRVGLGVGVGVRVRVGLGVGVGVRVPVGLGVGVGVRVPVGLGVGVGVRVRVGLGVGVGVVVVGVGVGVGLVHSGTVMTSSSRVTAPLRASARPMIVSPVVTVIEVRARTLPWKEELVPRVAELPTCQKTLQA